MTALRETQSVDNTLKKAAAASTGALITSLFVNPLDVAKVRLQSQIHMRVRSAAASSASFSTIKKRGSMVAHSSSSSTPSTSAMVVVMEQCRCKGRCPCNRVMTRSVEKLVTRHSSAGVLSCMRTMSCASTVPTAPMKLNGTSHALRHIFHTEGVKGLYSGLSPAMMIAVPSTVLYYMSYDLLLKEGKTRFVDLESIMPLLAGTSARVLAASVTSPLELIRTRIQGGSAKGTSVLGAFQLAIRQGGYQSLFNGLSATLARDVPFSAIYWTSYETLQGKLNANPDVSLSRTQRAFACGAISGAIAATITTPFDVLKTLQQVKVTNSSTTGIAQDSSGIQILQEILATRGVQGAFTGLTARLARVTPSCAIMISCYELGKQQLGIA